MKNKSHNFITIKISKLLAPIISSRDVANVLEDKINETDTTSVVLDFNNIKFVSRSATHSLLVLKEKIETNIPRRELSFINANNDVKEMIRTVASNRAFPKKETPEFNPEKTDIASLLEEAAF
ncbi:MAG: hypothetical protein A3D44_03500 [Candidatus Staskawiczbacteria bacterium RIFCSPHIGHO2_02_FULL_42_22]|uniref:STAS domain-containing protein n=1 Tax=Candidatus Staskawiczbacteria bacterium RIFCSPHIGHO2_02_FULL_42_22 TaxID=1802207 RepID=A0A1G2I3Q3_9BACT|nr:MAG: hypothetical protein A3D44_03500 [Candidatus Staskawiczbacteria bacterium RIFCSPHIGHO2_02_FULL_42_22]